MPRLLSCLVFLWIFLIADSLIAQDFIRDPFQSNSPIYSPTFADDIIIHDKPEVNQGPVAVCSAFNGWLFAVYPYVIDNKPWISLLKSTDNGETWSVLFDESPGLNNLRYPKIDIVATGTTVETIKLFLGILGSDSLTHNSVATVSKYDLNTGQWEGDELLQDDSRKVRDIALASDALYPASGSTPGSIAVIYSKKNIYDSIIFCSSSNGGVSFDNRQRIAGSDNYFHKVALAYGRSASYPSGRYFAAWEEQADAASNSGHIYTAHTEPNFNSLFTSPVSLDSATPGTANMLRNPAIACQFSNADNDSGNITQVIVCEKHNPALDKSDITGFFNRKAATTAQFYNFNPDLTTHNKLQPDIGFNPFDSTFMMTYFDSTSQKLPFLTKNFTMNNPDSWNVLSPGYNDNGDMKAPWPKVKLDPDKHTGANAWIGRRSNGNGVALFDAPYHYYTGIEDGRHKGDGLNLKVYPNPAASTLNVQFELKEAQSVAFQLFNVQGMLIITLPEKMYALGVHRLQIDMSDYSPGVYTLNCRNIRSSNSYKIVKIR